MAEGIETPQTPRLSFIRVCVCVCMCRVLWGTVGVYVVSVCVCSVCGVCMQGVCTQGMYGMCVFGVCFVYAGCVSDGGEV